MESQILKSYLTKFSKWNRATKNSIKAPHKPILLLAIIQSIEIGEIKENKIYITPELVARFKDYWKWLVRETFFSKNFSLPFFHLRSEKFWHLKTYFEKEILLTSSHFNELKTRNVLEYGTKLYFELVDNKSKAAFRFDIEIRENFKLLKDSASPSILLKGKTVYTVTEAGKPCSAEHHKSQMLKAMYDYAFSKSDNAKSPDFWEEIIIESTGQPLKSIRIF